MKYITIVVLFLFIVYYSNTTSFESNKKDEIELQIFNVVSILFSVLFIYYLFLYGIKEGLFKAVLIWAFFVVATPIPEAGLLLTMPLKKLLSIPMYITQFIASIIAFIYIMFSYFNYKKLMIAGTLGKFLVKILDNNYYSIFILCILSSTGITYLLDLFIDSIVYNEPLQVISVKQISIASVSTVCFFYYFVVLYCINHL